MKKLFFVFAVLFSAFFCSCVSSTSIVSKDGAFITEYDDIRNVTFITHENMKIGTFYNLRDSITGERINLRLYISNNNLVLSSDYQYRNWAFFKSVVFLCNSSRVVFDFDNRSSYIVSGSIVREQYDYIMNAADIESLYNLLSAGAVEVAFIGDKSNTGKLKISEKISSVMIETINRYKELKKIKIDCVSCIFKS